MVMAGLPLTFTPAGTVSVLLNVFFPLMLLTAGNPSSVAAPVSTRLVIVNDARTLKFLVTGAAGLFARSVPPRVMVYAPGGVEPVTVKPRWRVPSVSGGAISVIVPELGPLTTAVSVESASLGWTFNV